METLNTPLVQNIQQTSQYLTILLSILFSVRIYALMRPNLNHTHKKINISFLMFNLFCAYGIFLSGFQTLNNLLIKFIHYEFLYHSIYGFCMILLISYRLWQIQSFKKMHNPSNTHIKKIWFLWLILFFALALSYYLVQTYQYSMPLYLWLNLLPNFLIGSYFMQFSIMAFIFYFLVDLMLEPLILAIHKKSSKTA